MDRMTTLTHAAAATAVTIGGVATGLQYDVLLAGFAGALASLSYLEQMDIWRRMWTLITSALAAGYSGPVFAAYLSVAVPGLSSGDQAMLVFGGFVMGLSSQTLIPVSLGVLRARLAKLKK